MLNFQFSSSTQAAFDSKSENPFIFHDQGKAATLITVSYAAQSIQFIVAFNDLFDDLINKLKGIFEINTGSSVVLTDSTGTTIIQSLEQVQQDQSYCLWIVQEDDCKKLKFRSTFDSDFKKKAQDQEENNRNNLNSFLNEFSAKDDSKSKDNELTIMFCPFFNCRKEFRHSGNLKTHIRSHTNERPFLCDFPECGLSFITKGHLKTHQLNHCEDKPFKCEVCEISYSQKSRLQIHIRKHQGIKPYNCEFCGARFTEKGNLNVHLKSHLGQRNYTCEVCQQQFITKGHLEDHVRRHNKERKYRCEKCGSEFYRSTQLKNHQKNFERCHKNRVNRDYEEKFFQSKRQNSGTSLSNTFFQNNQEFNQSQIVENQRNFEIRSHLQQEQSLYNTSQQTFPSNLVHSHAIQEQQNNFIVPKQQQNVIIPSIQPQQMIQASALTFNPQQLRPQLQSQQQIFLQQPSQETYQNNFQCNPFQQAQQPSQQPQMIKIITNPSQPFHHMMPIVQQPQNSIENVQYHHHQMNSLQQANNNSSFLPITFQMMRNQMPSNNGSFVQLQQQSRFNNTYQNLQ